MFKPPGRKQLLSWIGQLPLLVSLWLGISSWQQKELLHDAQPAPAFALMSLDGELLRLEAIQSPRILLYFFAPWCSICKLSIGNLNELRDPSVTVLAIALSYDSPAAVSQFVGDQELTVPVLLGTQQTLDDYQIEMFPSYYVLDEEKRVLSKSVGYSTEIGMKARSWW